MAGPKPQPKKPDPMLENEDEGGEGDDAPLTRVEVTKMINSAVSGQLARKLPAAIEAGVSPVLAKLDEMQKSSRRADDDDGEDDDDAEDPPVRGKDEPDQGKRKDKTRPDPAVLRMQRKLDEMSGKLAKEEEARKKEEEARKNQTIDARLSETLGTLGVDKHRLRGALAVHKSSAFVDETGNVKYKVKRDGYEEDLDPSEALKEWSATDEGKSYLAPTGSTGGTGARSPGTPGPARKAPAGTPEAKAAKTAEAKTNLLGAVGALVGDGGSVVLE